MVLDVFPEPHHTTSVILSTVLPEVANQPHSAIIHVLHGARTAPSLVDQIFKELKQRGVIVKAGPLDKALDGVATGSRVAAQMTRNGDFDVIVSTAHGELLRSSLEVLATLGHLTDVGRVDVQTAPAMSLELLRKNATYCSVDFFYCFRLKSRAW